MRRDRLIDYGVSPEGRIVELWREAWRYVVKVHLELHSAVDPEQRQWVTVVHTMQTITTARHLFNDYMSGDELPERKLHPSAAEDGLSFIWDDDQPPSSEEQ